MSDRATCTAAQVEIASGSSPCRTPALPSSPSLSPGAHLPDEPGQNFEADAMAIKEIEKTTSTTTSKLWSTDQVKV
jgi:hypothetical protein